MDAHKHSVILAFGLFLILFGSAASAFVFSWNLQQELIEVNPLVQGINTMSSSLKQNIVLQKDSENNIVIAINKVVKQLDKQT